MKNESNIEGNHNIVIQGVNNSKIILNADGKSVEIEHKLDKLIEFVSSLSTKVIRVGDKQVNIDSLGENNLDFILRQAGYSKALPEDLVISPMDDQMGWIKSLSQELRKRKVVVSSKPIEVINHYGWLIEINLRKMLTKPGQKSDLRAFSFMTEAWFSSLRYLCYIQLAQLLKQASLSVNEKGEVMKSKQEKIKGFMQLNPGGDPRSLSKESRFDYLSFLTSLSDVDKFSFVAEMEDFLEELLDTETDLYSTTLFLEDQRERLLKGQIKLEELEGLLPKYLAGLTYWLRKISFLANYRMVSMKDVNVNYRLGTNVNFVHLYGELHGFYDLKAFIGNDYNFYEVEEHFTYNQSVLLFKGKDIGTCLDQIDDPSTYLSLSPFVIDQSVFSEKNTQTPEIFYYIGSGNKGKRFYFAYYKNELAFPGREEISSNKIIELRVENNKEPKLNELYNQMVLVLNPFKS